METGTRRPSAGVLAVVWAVGLSVLLLGPALLPGYVLTYDMVFVPHLALRPDFLGGATALPRALPSDAVVSVVDNLVPAMLLQKLVLVGALVGGAVGCARLAGPGLVARLTAVSVTIWNPFVLERLGIGHWTVLVGYGCVPWLVLGARHTRAQGRLAPACWWLLPLGSLSASAGVVSATVLLVCAAPWRAPRNHSLVLRLLALCAAANAPWVVAGILRTGDVLEPAAGATDLFGLHHEGLLPAPVAALGMGGIWNLEVVPDSRLGWAAWLGFVVLALVAAVGARDWWRRAGPSEGSRLLVCWGLGLGIALLTWAVPDAVDWFARSVPGGGLFRDGTRTLALCLPVYAGVLAAGAARIVARAGDLAPARVAGLVACVLFPVMLMPDGAWGLSGALDPADYPESWALARDRVDTGRGDVLLLPFSAYRAPAWNHGRTVIDPLGRYLRPDYLASDELVVSGRTLTGEDPRVPQVQDALDLDDAAARTRALASLGIGYVAIEEDTRQPPGDAAAVAGRTVVATADLTVVELPSPDPRPRLPLPQRALLALAWAVWLVTWGVALGTTRFGWWPPGDARAGVRV